MSHRAVAARAGVALSATTYYFSSLDELLAEAVGHLTRSWLASATAVVAQLPARLDGPHELAGALVDAVLSGVDDDAVLTMYERYLQAGRHPRLRPVVTAFGAQVDALLQEVLRRGGADGGDRAVRQVLAVVDGTVLRALAEGQDPRPAARSAVTPLLAAPDAWSGREPG